MPIGIDLGSLHARIAIGSLTQVPDVISNAQGSRYTLALVGDDTDADSNTTNGQEARHIFGEAARRALAREKKPTITKDPSSLVRELVKSTSSVVVDDNDMETKEKASKAAAFFSHLAELACDATSTQPHKLRTVVSVSVNATPEEQAGVVKTVECGINTALEGRMSEKEIKEMKKRAKKHGEEEEPYVIGVITDPAAVCIAHGLTEEVEQDAGVIDLAGNTSSPSSSSSTSTWKNVLVIDWGASGLTATHVSRTSSNSSLLTIVKSITDISCSGTSIISTLVKHCASMFERKSRVSGVLESKKACHRLEMACESAVRTLSRAPTTTVAVDGLYEGMDMSVPISRPRFDMLMSATMKNAETLLQTFVGSDETTLEFDAVLLAGNVCDMPAATTLIRTKLFPNANSGRGDIPSDEAVAIGCARYAASILSCETHSKLGGKGNGPATRTVMACPLTIGICRIENDKENGDIEPIISNTAVPFIQVGEPLPANVTRKIAYTNGGETWLDNSYIAIVQMGKNNKVLGKIEGIELEDKTFELTVELSTKGELKLAINGGEGITL